MFYEHIRFLLLSSLVLSSCPGTPTPVSSRPSSDYWAPDPDDRLQIQYANYPPDLSIDADIFSLDLFEVPIESIESLHGAGKKVICYVSTGSWEEYRPDAGDFPAEVIGRDYTGWEGEKWLDISHFELFRSIIEKRFDLAVEKGCDGIDADNMQNYEEDTGFAISAEDQSAYNIWLSGQAHQRGLSIGLKNDADQANDLEPYFDWSLVEECSVYGWCEMLLPFIKTGKPVFQVEYRDDYDSPNGFCPDTLQYGYSGLLKNRELDAWVEFCQ
jgi:hypothetical protein